MKTYHVYILTNKTGTLYTGMTGNLPRRIHQHKQKRIEGFTQKYKVDRLVHVEAYTDVNEAIAREKQIKGWRRGKKLASSSHRTRRGVI